MNIDALLRMACDIGHFFGAEPREEDRVAGVRNHLQKFWDPRMRRQILAHVKHGGQGLPEHVRRAVLQLETSSAS